MNVQLCLLYFCTRFDTEENIESDLRAPTALCLSHCDVIVNKKEIFGVSDLIQIRSMFG